MNKLTIDHIKDKILPSTIISRKIKLTKKGLNFWGLCPFHTEKTPSFSVNDNKKIYHCFGCGASGDIFEFIMATEGKKFTEAVETLSLLAGIPFSSPTKITTSPFQKLLELVEEWCIKQLPNTKALEYLKSRVASTSIQAFKLGYCPSTGLKEYLQQFIKNDEIFKISGIFSKTGKCLFGNRIIFPIYNSSRTLVGFGARLFEVNKNGPKYINSHETDLFKKGKILYGLNSNTGTYKTNVIVVEGYLDVIAMHESGFKNTVGILGTALTEEHLQLLTTITNQIIVCFDGDEGGRLATGRLIKMVLQNLHNDNFIDIKFVFLPMGYDPYDLIKKREFNIRNLLEQSLPISEAIWYSLTFNKKFTLPEEQMLLKQKIETAISIIPNPALRKKYFFYLIRKANNLFFQNNGKIRNSSKALMNLSKVNVNAEEKLLLQIVLKFPSLLLLPSYRDTFSNFIVRDTTLKALQKTLLQLLPMLKEDINEEQLLSLLPLTLYNFSTKLIKEFISYSSWTLEKAQTTWEKILMIRQIQVLEKNFQKGLTQTFTNTEAAQKTQQLLENILKLKQELQNFSYPVLK